MARINGSVGQKSDAYEFYIIWEESDVNIANNTSKITAKSYIYCKKHTAYNYDTYNHTITIDGQTFTTAVDGISLSAGVTKELAVASKVVTHNDDGSKSITISASSPKLPAGNGYGPASGSASGTATLTTIPRTSGVTCADGNIGSSTVINISRASSSFRHTLRYAFGSLSGIIVEKTSDTSIGWNIPTDFFSQIPNYMSGYGVITCETYSGDTLVGTSSCGFNAFVVNSNPTINGNVIDVNDRTVALTGDNNKIVKYCSNAKVDIVATAQNSSSITYVGVTAGNQSRDGSSVILESVETNVFNINCRDSRGLPGSNTIIKTLIDYIKLAFTSIDIQRATTTSNIVNVSLRGNYFNNSFGAVNNALTLKFRSRIVNGNWGDYIHLNANIDGNTFNYSGELGNNFDYQEGYEFEFYAEDRLMTDIKYRPLTAGRPIVDIGKNDVKVNGKLGVDGLTGDVTSDDVIYNKGRGHDLPAGEDTREYWNSLPNGVYWYGNTGAVPNMPGPWGFVEKMGHVGSGDFNILFYNQMTGPVYRKSGNHDGVSNWQYLNEEIFPYRYKVDEIYEHSTGGTNWLINTLDQVVMTRPDSNYNQYWFGNIHPLALKPSGVLKKYTLSFRYVPTNWDVNYRPASSIVVGGVSSGDAWGIRLYFNDACDWKIKCLPDYHIYSCTFQIEGNNDYYLTDNIRFILESSVPNIGGIVSHVKLEEGPVYSTWTPSPFGDCINVSDYASNYSCLHIGDLQVAWGRTSITPTAAGEPTRQDIIFPKPFRCIPAMIVTANTRVPTKEVTGWGYAGTSTTGTELWVTRNNTTATNLCWVAIGQGK